MLNHITIMGRLTRDPELRYTPSQTPVTTFSLAVERDYTNRDTNERQTDFIDCVAWRSAEFVSKYFQKGSMAVVSGRLQIREWTDRDGNKRRSPEVNVENVYFGDSKRREGDVSASPYGGGFNNGNSYSSNDYAPQSDSSVQTDGFEELSDDDGELPF
ncbi:MAG: single-stranded DNA-binding protein [Oscillospiraceae bacterium]|nr:single-stranded DNA-binding protein [Oscillospiraceae bacterium]